MKTIDDYNFKGKRALIRVDFNVPLDKELNVTDTTRIDAAVPTIKKILGDNGSAVLMSHLGRPKEGPEDKYSLRHVVECLSDKLNNDVEFAEDCVGDKAKKQAKELNPGEVLLLENLRFHEEEKNGDEGFSKKLSGLGDIYVNDAFGTAHRAHASTAIIAKYFPDKKCFGYLMEKEIKNLDKLLENPEKPFTAILGGAKVSGKIEVIKNLLDKIDNLIIGGGMMFTFIKALGGNIGKSLVEDDLIDTTDVILEKARGMGINIYIPKDAIAADKFESDAEKKSVSSYKIPEDWMGLDIGEESCKLFSEVIGKSKTILWNGPMGVFELAGFEKGTECIAKAIVKATEEGAYSLLGGGDSVAAINKIGLADKVSFVSTGGGAMLEYIEGKKLPGIKAIEE